MVENNRVVCIPVDGSRICIQGLKDLIKSRLLNQNDQIVLVNCRIKIDPIGCILKNVHLEDVAFNHDRFSRDALDEAMGVFMENQYIHIKRVQLLGDPARELVDFINNLKPDLVDFPVNPAGYRSARERLRKKIVVRYGLCG